MNDHFTILGSGIGLGFYIPGLIISEQLKVIGGKTEMFVFENYLKLDKRENIQNIKKAFQKNYALALIGQKVIKDITPNIDEELVTELIDYWTQKKKTRFLCFSGFWMPILHSYFSKINFNIEVDLCHVDAIASTSWKMYDTDDKKFNQIWFSNWENKSIPHYIDVSNEEPIDFDNRNNRFYIHGGGWGIGDFYEKYEVLLKKNYGILILKNNEESYAYHKRLYLSVYNKEKKT